MALSAGARLGPYEVVAAIGAGGMGEVYKARDTRLERTVAIKILPDTLAADSQFRERFDREARAISQLDHPHICALYDVGEQDGTAYLVMQYLEGNTLADRLATGAVPLDEALRIAIEIASALVQAHRAGIVHRDLKPGNIMLTKAGAKLLDFGLAKSGSPVVVSSGLSMLPTTPPTLTAQGTILGTFQYMAPEQIEGLEADARTDIFAFGALLFEMLTGRTAFEGKTRASLLGAILKDDPPPVSRLQPVAPAALDRIISTCLAKDADDRYQTARDLLRDLKWVASESRDLVDARVTVAPARSSRLAWVLAAVFAIAFVAAAAMALRRGAEVAPAAESVEFTIAPPQNTFFGGPISGGTGTATQVAISPDGRTIAFVARAQSAYQIWLRPVATQEARPLSGTEGAAFPFWSPDNRWIGFFAAGKLKKIQIAGGPPVPLCDAPAARGGSWSREGVIVFAPGPAAPGLQRVSSAGGTPSDATRFDASSGETNHRWPHFLPDGRHFLFTATSGTCCPAAKPSVIKIGSLDQAEEPVTLLQAESAALYAASHVLFVGADLLTLMAQAFDPTTRELKGEAFPIAGRVTHEGSRYVGASASENGTLVYGQGGSTVATQLTWFDRTGRALGTIGEVMPYINIDLSPDDSKVAVSLGSGTPDNRDIHVIDIARNLPPSRLTFDPTSDSFPVWSPDGTRIAFFGARAGKPSLRQIRVGGASIDEPLIEGDKGLGFTPSSWTRDGRFIAYSQVGMNAASDVWVLPLTGDRKPFRVVQNAASDTLAVFSPDGRWIAYTSSDGQSNVYVQAFPAAGGKQQVSRNGGSHPLWRADGKELFYLDDNGTIVAVPVETSGEFVAGAPQALFPSGATRLNAGQVYDVAKDGKRFLVNARPQGSGSAPLTVVLNWPATIRK